MSARHVSKLPNSRSSRRRNNLRGAAEGLERRAMLSATPQDLAVALTHSAEHYANVVQHDYQQYLGRGADAQGQQHWVSAMQHGETAEQMEAEFIGSNEYIANHGGSQAEWVKGMYQDLLGRSADQQGLDDWTQALKSGTSPSTVAHGFAASHERETQRVHDDYTSLLGRAPSAAEVESWVSAFEHGVSNDDVVAGFVGSPEFYHNHGGNKADFVKAAYQDVLHRDADSDSEQFWLEDMGTNLQANLTSTNGSSGQAEYKLSTAGNEFQVEVHGAAANSTLNVTIDGAAAGQVVVGANGEGKLSYSSQAGSHETPFPSGFPQVQANSTISVGSALSGQFKAQVDG